MSVASRFFTLLKKYSQNRYINRLKCAPRMMSEYVGGAAVKVGMDKAVSHLMEDQFYPFESIKILNRLDMSIVIDICPVQIENEMIMLVRANKAYHRSVIEKNSEHIAFQLREQHVYDGQEFSLVECVDRHSKQDQPVEWRQWRFKWVGNSPINGHSYPLPSVKLSQINMAVTSDRVELQNAS